MSAIQKLVRRQQAGSGGGAPPGFTLFSTLGLVGGNDFIVLAGAKIYIDIDTPALGCMEITGDVIQAPGKVLTTGCAEVFSGGTFVATNGSMVLNGPFVPLTGSGTNLTNPGLQRSLMVFAGGSIEITGTVPTTLYTTLNAHAANAATALTLAASVGWSASDAVVVAPTDFPEFGATHQSTLNGATSGTSATLSTGLSASRWGLMQYPIDTPVSGSGMSLSQGTFVTKKASAFVATQLDERARVANLTRGYTISAPNDSDWSTKGHGATIMWEGNATVKLHGVQIRRGGQRGALGRYPFHAHMNSYTQATGAFTADRPLNYVRKCVVWESENRAFTIHGTCGMDVSDNISYLAKGHAFFLEDGSERRNTIRRNMAFSTRNPSAGTAGVAITSMSGNGVTSTVNATAHGLYTGQPVSVTGASISGFNLARVPVTVVTANQYTYLSAGNGTPTGASYIKSNDRIKLHDESSGGFWITNMDNKVEDNYACDSDGSGFWMSLGPQCFGASALVPIVPSSILTDKFSGSISHSNKKHGMRHADGVVDENGTANFSAGKYLQAVGGSFTSSGHVLWKNAEGGYSNFVNQPIYDGWTVADNAGGDFFGATNPGGTAPNHLGIAYSLNNANAKPTGFLSARYMFATYHGTVQFLDITAINYAYEPTYYEYSTDRGLAGGVTQGGADFYDTPGIDTTTGLNSNIRMINCHPGAMTPSPNIDNRTLAARHYSTSAVWKDTNGYWGTAGKYQLVLWPATGLVDDFLLSGAANVADGPTTGTVVCKTTDTRFFGVGCIDNFRWTLAWAGTPAFGNLSSGLGGQQPGDLNPLTVIRQGLSTGTQIGSTWRVNRGDTSVFLGTFRTVSLQNGARYTIDFSDAGYAVTVPDQKLTMDIVNANSGTGDFVLLGLPWANGATARVCFGNGFTGESNTFASAADVSAGRAKLANVAATGADAAAKIAAVLADTTGATIFQDTTANRIWVRYTGGYTAATIAAGNGTIDRQTIVIKA